MYSPTQFEKRKKWITANRQKNKANENWLVCRNKMEWPFSFLLCRHISRPFHRLLPPQKKTSSGQPLFKFNKLTNIYFQHTYTDIRPIQLNKYRTKLQQIECNRPTFVTDDQQLGLYIHVLLMCNKSQSTQHITSQANVSLFESKAKEKSTITHHSLFSVLTLRISKFVVTN